MIRAYDELYLDIAQNILGHAVDFAVVTLGIDPELFGKALSVAPSAKQFAAGNPAFVAGINGCEFARCVLDDVRISYSDTEDIMYLDKSPEYWCGWALAFFQWYSDYSFMDILKTVSIPQILQMYPIYHEMDIMKFVSQMQRQIQEVRQVTRLRMYRDACRLSQSELASASGVPLRQVQLFEQRQRDINKAAGATLFRLSKVLQCRVEDLLEKESLG